MASPSDNTGGAPSGPSPYPDESENFGRVLALSDGVFAFAMTLLVIYLAIPSVASNQQLGDYLQGHWTEFAAYVLAFFIVGNWWTAHRRLFNLLHRLNRTVVDVNLVFLFFIAITPFTAGLLVSHGDYSIAVGFYAVSQALAGSVLLGLRVYIRRSAQYLTRPGVSDATLRNGVLLGAIPPAAFVLSVPVALESPYAAIGMWLAMFALLFVVRRTFLGPSPNASPGKTVKR